MDGKRRKLKEELEARERLAASKSASSKNKSAEQLLKEEVERLRKEGSRQVQEEMEYVMRRVKEEQENQTDDFGKYRLKIKWKAGKHDPDNGGYSEELLQNFLSKYGDITVLVVSSKKKGSALVEFKTLRAAVSNDSSN